jgi:tRNA(fMet)-specific endonuclease VapC
VIHLDTSFLVDLLRESDRGVAGPASRQLNGMQNEELRISLFVACELAAGAAMSRKPSEERHKIERLLSSLTVEYPDQRFPGAYASLLAAQDRGSGRISTMDLLIATSAVLAQAPLLTRNARDFSRVPGLETIGY